MTRAYLIGGFLSLSTINSTHVLPGHPAWGGAFFLTPSLISDKILVDFYFLNPYFKVLILDKRWF